MPSPDNRITVWPCDHGNVLVEPGFVPKGATCAVCGANPRHYVAVDTLPGLLTHRDEVPDVEPPAYVKGWNAAVRRTTTTTGREADYG